MPCLRSTIVAAGFLLASIGASAAPDWTKAKSGMTNEEVAKQLGEPLIRTYGRGIEVWIYDGRGEALFSGGPLKSWSVAEPTAESLARPVEQDVLIKPVRRTRARLAPVQSLPVRTGEAEGDSRFRYLQR